MLPPVEGPGQRRKRDSIPSDPTARITLCTPGTKTYVRLTRKPPNGDFNIDKSDPEIQEQITGLIANTWSFIDREHLKNGHEDGVIDKSDGWVFERTSTHGKYILQVANAHHRKYVPMIHWGTVKIVGYEITWGVLQSALTAVGMYMRSDVNKWTECVFQIWDGRNQVGIGRIIKAGDAHD
ncbi:MAG: hypothetical protein Q9196_005516 [Gyalolechia fulgens]